MRFEFGLMPFLKGARRYAQEWAFPGGSIDNKKHYGPHVDFAPGLDEACEMLLFDAQTSGGLLLAVPQERLAAFKAGAVKLDQPVWEVGEVVEGQGIRVE